jgi:hypothetical protein
MLERVASTAERAAGLRTALFGRAGLGVGKCRALRTGRAWRGVLAAPLGAGRWFGLGSLRAQFRPCLLAGFGKDQPAFGLCHKAASDKDVETADFVSGDFLALGYADECNLLAGGERLLCLHVVLRLVDV